MVILNVDHPDIEEFIWCKAREERKARALRDAGFDMDLDGTDSHSIQYQNANNSVRVTDEFMQAVVDDADWHLRAVTTGEVIKTVRARDLMRQIAEAAWECADPGHAVRHHDQPLAHRGQHRPHQRLEPVLGVHAPRQLGVQPGQHQPADVPRRATTRSTSTASRHAVEVVFTAQEILVGNADYPTDADRRDDAASFRQLGLGYANLGALLMALGLPYDSDEGRAWAAAITALMTGHAYATSARTAARMGPFAGYAENARAHAAGARHAPRGGGRHRRGARPRRAARRRPAGVGRGRASSAEQFGVRNSQATVLAPTGTIGLMMDCDTTGIEPDLGLCKIKKLVGGGTMSIVNQTVPRALRRLGYTPSQIDEIVAYIDEHKSILGAPHLAAEHVPVFACSMGDNAIHYLGPRADDGGGPAVHLAAPSPRPSTCPRRSPSKTSSSSTSTLAARHQGRRHLPRQLQGGPAPGHGQEGATRRRRHRRPRCRRQVVERIVEQDRPGAGPREAAPDPHVDARSSSGWPTARASSPSASTTTAGPARSSSGCRSRARPSPGSWTPSPSRSATACSTACRCGPSSRRSPTCASSRPA